MRFGYARVSTRDQNPDSQADALLAASCERLFTDRASGKLARRPKWDKLYEQLRAGDELVITRLSRLARSVHHLTELAGQLHHRKVDLIVLHQGIDTTTSAGRFLFHVLAAQDEMLADLISEGTLEGLAAARARGRRGGRPTVMTPAKLQVARHMLDAGGHTVTEVAATIGVGRGTLYRPPRFPYRQGWLTGAGGSVDAASASRRHCVERRWWRILCVNLPIDYM